MQPTPYSRDHYCLMHEIIFRFDGEKLARNELRGDIKCSPELPESQALLFTAEERCESSDILDWKFDAFASQLHQVPCKLKIGIEGDEFPEELEILRSKRFGSFRRAEARWHSVA